MMLKFNEGTIKTQITAFQDAHDRKPYIICSEETYKLLSTEYSSDINGEGVSWIPFSTNASITLSTNKKKFYYHSGCKVFFDDGLKVGDIIFA